MKDPIYTFRVALVIMVASLGVAPMESLLAQSEIADKGQKDRPVAKVHKHGWGPNGELALAIRLHAPPAKELNLGSDTGSTISAYTLESSYLIDLYTEERFTPLDTQFRKPYFGPPGTLVALQPKAWIQLGITFPALPKPPTKDGKVLPYRLRFHPPGGLAPVTFEIPYDPAVGATKGAAGSE